MKAAVTKAFVELRDVQSRSFARLDDSAKASTRKCGNEAHRMTKFPRDTRPMQSIGKTPDLIFALSRSQKRLRSTSWEVADEREVFPGGESRESCRTQGFRQDQAADASFGGRVEEIVIMQPSDGDVQGLGI